MRTPIASILFFLQQIIEIIGADTFKRKQIKLVLKNCRIMTSQLEFLQSFVDDLLDLSQIRNGVFSLSREEFNITDMIKLILSIFRPVTIANSIDIYASIQGYPLSNDDPNQSEANSMPRLIGDSRRVKQILMNLLKNSIKFTEAGYISIKVFYDESQQNLRIEVQDTGVGIAPQDVKKIFSRFGKLKRTAEMNSEGIGLGLTIVKQITESYHGQVSVHSDGLGKGCLFKLNLNIQAAV